MSTPANPVSTVPAPVAHVPSFLDRFLADLDIALEVASSFPVIAPEAAFAKKLVDVVVAVKAAHTSLTGQPIDLANTASLDPIP